MQFNKQLIVIIILASLLLSAIGTSYYFYDKNQQELQKKKELVTVFIAKEDIPKNILITNEHVTQTNIAKQFILNEPLLKQEIIGKFTNEKIYKNEIFLKQKLDTELKKEQAKILEFEKSAYNMKFELFKNPNYALVQGEYINVASVYPIGETDSKGRYLDFEVGYVAPNIKVLGFIRNGVYESKAITQVKVKKVINKETKEVIEDVKSDEILLDIDLDVLTKLLRDYNMDTQLWMTRTKYSQEVIKNKIEQDEKKEAEAKKDFLKENDIEHFADNKNSKSAEKKISKPVEPKKYKYEMYNPKDTSFEKQATIDYANGDKSVTKSVKIDVDMKAVCSNIKDKYLLGKVNWYYIRSQASKTSDSKKLLRKNIIIPYLMKDNEWYVTCDKNYIHESVVEEVTPTFVNEKLGKYE